MMFVFNYGLWGLLLIGVVTVDSSLGDATLPRQASARAQLPDFPGPTSRDEQRTINRTRRMDLDHSIDFSKVAQQS